MHDFTYLGRIITDTDDDKATVTHNLKKAGKAWDQLHRLLSYERKRNVRSAVSGYQAIVESIWNGNVGFERLDRKSVV